MYHAVIRLRYEDSITNEISGHAVAVKESFLQSNLLNLTVVDSSAGEQRGGINKITVPVYYEGGRRRLKIGGEKDEWCLGDENCYYLCF